MQVATPALTTPCRQQSISKNLIKKITILIGPAKSQDNFNNLSAPSYRVDTTHKALKMLENKFIKCQPLNTMLVHCSHARRMVT